MPGINLLCTKEKKYHEKFDLVQNKMLHLESYSKKTLVADDRISLGFTSYSEYPRTVIEKGSLLIVLEGMVYGKTENDVIDKVSQLIIENNIESLKSFLQEIDGEFIITIYDKKHGIVYILNDALGRLPIYYHHSNNNLIVSREIKFIIPFMEQVEFDNGSIIETMLYGFPFGERTLIKNVYRALPATLIKFNIKTSDFMKKEIVPINFDIESKSFDNTATQIKNIKNIFMKAVKARADRIDKNRKLLISVSGGLDSRAVLSAMSNIEHDFKAVTWLRPPNDELVYSKMVGETFGINLDIIPISKDLKKDDYEKLVFLRDGMNTTKLAFSISIYEKLIKKYGQNIFLCTGVYGGELYREPKIVRGLHSMRGLLNSIINTNDGYKYPTGDVAKMLNMPKSQIRDHILKHLKSYEEKSLYKKYLHFKKEREYKWIGEGEDRARMFYWCSTPFYSLPFHDYSTYHIQEEKKGLPFFREFLYQLDPRSCIINYYNDGTSLKSGRNMKIYKIKEWLVKHPTSRYYGKVFLNTKKKLKESIRSSPASFPDDLNLLKKMIFDILESSHIAKKHFSIKNTKDIIGKENNDIRIHRLLTILLYMKQIENNL